MSEILQFDYELFTLINEVWKNALFDALLPFWRNKYVWLPLYVFIISFLLINYGRRGMYYVLLVFALVFISDTMSSKLIKNWIQRVRPCNQEEFKDEVRLLVSCGSGYSFTSSHATNHFALAFFLILTLGKLFRKIRIPLIIWAALVAYAQVYVGVHFPLDVIAGALLGTLIARVLAGLYHELSFFHLTPKA